jgi:YfiR/HmsC-like
MRIRTLILWSMAASLLTASLSATVRADSATDREYRLKAAFLYSFMMFVEGGRFQWKSDDQEPSDPNEHVQIGIIGHAPFGNAFEPLKNKKIKNRAVTIKWFKGLAELAETDGRRPQQHPQIEAIRQCHLLFICSSEKAHIDILLSPIRTLGMLTVADMPGFLEAGGMVNFVIEDKKVRFEINSAAAKRARLQIRAKLLRLARRVITHDAFERNDDE